MTTTTHQKVEPKDFALVLGAVITLFTSVISLLTLLTSYVDFLFPDPLEYSYGASPYSSGVLVAMAFLIVVVPTYLVLTRLLNRDVQRHPAKRELWVRRWAVTGALFVGAIAIAVSLIVLVASVLQGELTLRFLLKILAIVLVVGGFVLYYAFDLRGRWQERPAAPRAFGIAVGAVVLATIVSGFAIVGTPGELREYREDDRRIGDLQSIQWGVIDRWQSEQQLPASLAELSATFFGGSIPVDPVTGESYGYRVTGDRTFELCATFNRETWRADETTPSGLPAFDNWTHDAGEFCFSRTIDPAQFPPYQK